mmetsp:Transcript_112751/g.318707  ORF Transcript_112751/g.318707 Transcript_112751/m.318707 type:complete len:297 (-) Transcript_112751:148-1038(-)
MRRLRQAVVLRLYSCAPSSYVSRRRRCGPSLPTARWSMMRPMLLELFAAQRTRQSCTARLGDWRRLSRPSKFCVGVASFVTRTQAGPCWTRKPVTTCTSQKRVGLHWTIGVCIACRRLRPSYGQSVAQLTRSQKFGRTGACARSGSFAQWIVAKASWWAASSTACRLHAGLGACTWQRAATLRMAQVAVAKPPTAAVSKRLEVTKVAALGAAAVARPVAEEPEEPPTAVAPAREVAAKVAASVTLPMVFQAAARVAADTRARLTLAVAPRAAVAAAKAAMLAPVVAKAAAAVRAQR